MGGLDVLFEGLSKQRERNFELVLADGVHRFRERVPDHQFAVQHVPVEASFEKNEYCKTVNAGVAAAKGDIVLFLTDYTWIPENYLETHASWHDRNRDPLDCLTTPHRYAKCPGVADRFPRYGMSDHGRYKEDLEKGRLGGFSVSIFDRDFCEEDIETDTRHVRDIDADGTEVLSGGLDPKEEAPEGRIGPWLVHLKGDSVKAELISRVSSRSDETFPVELDGGHGYQDTWFALRSERTGARWTLTKHVLQWIPQVRDKFPRMPRTRKFTEQEALMQSLVLRP